MSQLKRLRESGSQESLVKKYKGTSQITTCSLSKKNNKTYSHHDDDDGNNDDLYAKDGMTIGHVKKDYLAEIFMYVPACERPEIALVCKRWKRALDNSWFKVKKLELTHWEYDECPNFFEKNYRTLDGQFNFLKSLLNKCGRYLTELELSSYAHCNIVPVINKYCPNLVKLRIRIVYIDNAILDNAFTRLSKLKVLKIIFQCFKNYRTELPITLINSLLNVADTLTELSLSNWPRCMGDNTKFPEEMTDVVSKLTALKTFHFAGIRWTPSLCNYLNPRFASKTLSLFLDDYYYLENKMTIISLYARMEELYIRDYGVTDNFLYNIANLMRQLRTLRIPCGMVTDAGIVAVSKINNLKLFVCWGFNNVTDSSIKLLKNMVELYLPWSNKITNKSATKVLENSPEMQYLSLENTGVTSEFIKKAKEISRNRKKQLTLVMSCEDGMPTMKIKYEYLTVYYVEKQKQQNENNNNIIIK